MEANALEVGRMCAVPMINQNDDAANEGSSVELSIRERRDLERSAVEHKRNLQENGIPADVLDALLSGDDVIELEKPTVAGGIVYRFTCVPLMWFFAEPS